MLYFMSFLKQVLVCHGFKILGNIFKYGILCSTARRHKLLIGFNFYLIMLKTEKVNPLPYTIYSLMPKLLT